jgi:hypothetical protein
MFASTMARDVGGIMDMAVRTRRTVVTKEPAKERTVAIFCLLFLLSARSVGTVCF